MAIDEVLRLKVQAVYESNDLSVRKVVDRFAAYDDIKEKTVESWVRKYSWKKNRFNDEIEAIDELINNSLPMDDIKKVVRESMLNDSNKTIEGEIIDDEVDKESEDDYLSEVSKELAYKVLNVHSLQGEIAENLNRSRKFAQKAKTIGAVKVHHDMLVSAYQTIHGKQINLAPVNPNSNVLSEEEVQKLPDEELDRLITGE